MDKTQNTLCANCGHSPHTGECDHEEVSGGTFRGTCGCDQYQPEKIKDPAAVALGKKGGSAKSEAKTAAVKENGKKGGRPRRAFATQEPRDKEVGR